MEEEKKRASDEGGLHFLEGMNQDQIRHDMMENGRKNCRMVTFFRKLFKSGK